MTGLVLALLFVTLGLATGDTPANCHYQDIVGKWVIGTTTHSQTEGPNNCSNVTYFDKTYKIQLIYPDVAIDQFGNVGFWTLVYNQGFEIKVAGTNYFAFFRYQPYGGCNETFMSWSQNSIGKNWRCFWATKSSAFEPRPDSGPRPEPAQTPRHVSHPLYIKENVKLIDELLPAYLGSEFAERINSFQSSWRAEPWQLRISSWDGYLSLAGGLASSLLWRPKPAPVTASQDALSRTLPEAWDWRNVDGSNFVSPIRNQGSCGSCYAFASMALLESRILIMTNGTQRPVFAPQDVVECSAYSQGCQGGFPYLVAGKYAQDYGVVQEMCNPYKGINGPCSTVKNCPHRYFATNYRYIGGYYGGSNEPLIRAALVARGPIAVSFQVYPDFMHYSGGIYHHVTKTDDFKVGFDPFELTNHVVLIVGYGTDSKTGLPYWTVKNSWGTEWGEAGFFRIRRGSDECAIESIAVEVDPLMG